MADSSKTAIISGQYITQITGYKSFIPNSLQTNQNTDYSKKLHALTELKLAQLDAAAKIVPNPQLFLSMYIRKEALLSSQIEGTQATFEDILTYETWDDVSNFDDVEEVVNYIKALNHGLKQFDKIPISVRLIKQLHQILMTGVRGATKTPGDFRKSQNWIGPPGLSLKHATFVPPPPHEMLQALSDLEKFINADSDIPPLVKCAIIHYQFETIHPFLDGNGRIGRLLIMLHLLATKQIRSPLLYPSLFLKLNKQEYFDRLMLVRTKSDFSQWIDFFLRGMCWSADQAINTIHAIANLQYSCIEKIKQAPSRSIYLYDLLDQLFISPLVTIGDISKKLGVSFQTASVLTKQFVSMGLLEELKPKKRMRRYAFASYLKIIEMTQET
ncbi:MAG: Fic family protein [Chlamydiia bacterium]|nr:Fic family protein [Chlamydiia bacterium]